MKLVRHIRVEKVQVGTVCKFLVFDLHLKALVHDLTNFGDFLTKERGAHVLTTYKKLTHAIRFKEFCRLKGVALRFISDTNLTDYRDWEMSQVVASPSHRGDERTAKRTTNAKLDSVFDLLRWHQQRGELTRASAYIPKRADGGKYNRERVAQRSSVYFTKTGKAAKHHSGFILGDEELRSVLEHAVESRNDPHAAHRNWIMGRIGHLVGLRRGSVNSLLAGDFERRSLEKKLMRSRDDGITLVPKDQKFDYNKAYFFPAWLCYEICSFCENYRAPLISLRNDGKDVSRGRLFLSSTTAKPMAATSISRIYRVLMAEVDAPKGVAFHILRDVFASARLAEETEYRVEAGLDTSTKSLSTAVSMAMGQEDPNSMFRYVQEQQSVHAQKRAAEKKRLIEKRENDYARVLRLLEEKDQQIAELQSALMPRA